MITVKKEKISHQNSFIIKMQSGLMGSTGKFSLLRQPEPAFDADEFKLSAYGNTIRSGSEFFDTYSGAGEK
jgi:hypothetical protein